MFKLSFLTLFAITDVNLIVRFANLENKFGEKERAQTLFENILTSYPKRVDVWSCYVDSLIKSEDIDMARYRLYNTIHIQIKLVSQCTPCGKCVIHVYRKVLERACALTLPARKMKTLFKKYISFEEKYGSPEAVNRVTQLAADYVEKQCNKE